MKRIDLRHVEVRYRDQTVLPGLSLSVNPGECLAVLGPSGCGKTTLLRVLGGLVHYRGSVLFDGLPVDHLPTHERHVGIVFQNYALFQHLTVRENISFGLRMRRADRRMIVARVDEMEVMLRLSGLLDRYPAQLSGGQQQRVALARAIAPQPAVLLLDEPLAALDRKLREEMQVELRQLQRRIGVTTIIVTHDQDEALSLSDRVAVMQAGTVEQIGSPAEIYESPNSVFVADFIGATNRFPATVEGRHAAGYRCRTEGGDSVVAGRSSRDLRAGERVELSLRPERLALRLPHRSGEEIDAGEDLNRLACTIGHVTYLGAAFHVTVITGGGATLRIDLQNARGRAQPSDWRPGADALIEFHPADTMILSTQ